MGFVGQHLDEAGMGEEHKGLVVPPAEWYLLLPAVILPDHQCPDPPLNKEVNNMTASNVQIVSIWRLRLSVKTIKTV